MESESYLTLRLTGEQREVVRNAAGIDLSELRYRVSAAAGVALLSRAVVDGYAPLGSSALIGIDLTPSQSELLQASLGGEAPLHWLIDADHIQVRHAEDWTHGVPVPLGTIGFAVPSSAADPPQDALIVRLPEVPDGQAVFGTGHHTTTRLAAQLLQDLVEAGDTVVDLGTGSGLLAVFAVRLGARHVRALDISEAAVEVAIRTAELNGVSHRIDVELAELGNDHAPVDLLVANVLPGMLLDLMPALAANVLPMGTMITSGVVDARAQDVVAAATAVGFLHSRSVSDNGWTASVFRRGEGG